MLIYLTTDDGTQVSGPTALDVVADLWLKSGGPPEELQAWMEAVAVRACVQTGRTVRASSPEVFLTGLEEAGLITKIVLN